MACMRTIPALLSSFPILAAIACVGDIEHGASLLPEAEGGGGQGPRAMGGRGGGSLPGPVETGGSDIAACAPSDVGRAPFRRLTRTQYMNTVADLLGREEPLAVDFPPDESVLGFSAGLGVSPLLLGRYQATAEGLAASAAADLGRLLGCDPAAAGEACLGRFVDRFGSRAFRRPLDEGERRQFLDLYQAIAPAHGPQAAVEAVVQAFLQAPQFLYRVELAAAAPGEVAVPLSGYEVATRLSYFLWDTMPDDELFRAAAAGELAQPAGLEKQARRMLAHPRARGAVRGFVDQWLELEGLDQLAKDTKLYPQWTPKLRHSMHEAALRLGEHAFIEPGGTLHSLLRSPTSFVDAALATNIYEVQAPAGGQFARMELDGTRRAGVLTLPAILALTAKHNQSSPVHRGKFVRERLLCQTLPDPPADLVVEPPDPDPRASTRARFAEHTNNPACAPCHRLVDPIGFGFENYDAIGRFRTKDGTFDVDASGEVIGTRGANGAFRGAVELGERLAGSEEAAACVVDQWFIFALGRAAGEGSDACSRERLLTAFARSGNDLGKVLVSLVLSDAFRYLRVE